MSETLIEQKKSQDLASFNITDAALAKYKAEYMPLVINGIDDKEGYKLVDAARKIIKAKRIEIEKRRKELKEESLNYGRWVDGQAKNITQELDPIETHLTSEQQRIDQVIEERRKEEQRRRDAIFQNRVNELTAVNYPIDVVRLRCMSDEEFAAELVLAKDKYQVEQERLAEEAKAKEEQEARHAEELRRREREVYEANKKIQEMQAAQAAKDAEVKETMRRMAEEEQVRRDELNKAQLEIEKIQAAQQPTAIVSELEHSNDPDVYEVAPLEGHRPKAEEIIAHFSQNSDKTVMAEFVKFTPEQIDYVCKKIDSWHFSWENCIVDHGAKEQLKVMIFPAKGEAYVV